MDDCRCYNEAVGRHDAVDKHLPVVLRRFHPFQHWKDDENEVLQFLQSGVSQRRIFLFFTHVLNI